MKNTTVLCIWILIIPFIAISQNEKQKSNQNDPIVYITRTGTKYHTSDCRYLKGNGIPKKLSEVKGSYSPCSICRPPESKVENTNISTKKTEQNTNKEPDKSSIKETPSGKTQNGTATYTGPRGGVYHYSKSGKKVYQRRK